MIEFERKKRERIFQSSNCLFIREFEESVTTIKPVLTTPFEQRPPVNNNQPEPWSTKKITNFI